MTTAASKLRTEPLADDRQRIVLVDDHAMMREGLAQAIGSEADLVVCGGAETAAEALEIIADTQPHLVIVDLALKESDGLDLIKDIRVRWPRLRVLVVSMHEDPLFAERALRSGASGYLTKREATRTLVRAIRQVLGGGIHLSDAMAAQIAAQVVGATRPKAGLAVEKLSDRELQVFRLIGQGFSTREILRAFAPGPEHGGYLPRPSQRKTWAGQCGRITAHRHRLDPWQFLPLTTASV